jgi:Mg-chelatase subunit ChlD
MRQVVTKPHRTNFFFLVLKPKTQVMRNCYRSTGKFLLCAATILALVVFAPCAASAQNLVEAGSQGNTIALDVDNESGVFPLEGVTVEAVEYPDWIMFTQPTASPGAIAPGQTSTATLGFDVASDAEDGDLGQVRVRVRTSPGDEWAGSGLSTQGASRPDLVFYLEVEGRGAAVSYVLDRSGSMRGSPLSSAKTAASQGIATTEIGDEVGVVSFSSGAVSNFPLTEITEGGGVRSAAIGAVNGLSAGGGTSIGSGLRAAYNQLVGSSAKELDYVLLSDGKQNEPPPPSAVLPDILALTQGRQPLAATMSGPGAGAAQLASFSETQSQKKSARIARQVVAAQDADEGTLSRIYTIAYGAGADQQLLSDLAAQTGGLFLYAPSRNDPLALGNLFNAIQGRISNEQRLASYDGSLSAPDSTSYTFDVTSDISEETVKLLWDNPRDSLSLELMRPDSTVFTPDNIAARPGVSETTGPGIRYYTLLDPQEGEWTARVKAVETSGSARYALALSAQSSVQLDAAFARSRYYAGQPIQVTAVLTEDDEPLTGATVEVDVDAPTGAQSRAVRQLAVQKPEAAEEDAPEKEGQTRMAQPSSAEAGAAGASLQAASASSFELFDDGSHGDSAAGDGVYGNTFTNTSGVGSYTFRLSASGQTQAGEAFTRQATRSVFVAPAGQEAPTLLAPADGQAELSLPPLLAWSPVDEAASYRVQLDTTASFSRPIVDESAVQDTTFAAEELSLGTTYYWRVRARKENGRRGDWSLPRTFTTTTDATPPDVALAEPTRLWPPNHKYVQFAISDMVNDVTDNVAGTISTDSVFVTSVSSDEPENSFGDGNTTDDIVIGEEARSVQLRSERQGGGNGRVYLVNLAVSDPNGNVAEVAYRVEVPKSKKRDATADDPAYTVESGAGPSAAVAAAGEGQSSTISQVPDEFALQGAYPNPTSGRTTVPLDLPEAASVRVEAFDVLGRRVQVLADEALSAGRHRLVFETQSLASGLYLIRATVDMPEGGKKFFTAKVTVVK